MSSESDKPSTRRWAIIGAGRVGRTLGLLARRIGVEHLTTWNRTASAADATDDVLDPDEALHGPLEQTADALVEGADVAWITVVDEAIEPVARTLADKISGEQIVLHTAGSLSSNILSRAGLSAAVGSLHPLQAITDPHRAVEQLSEVAWTLEGDDRAQAFGRELLAHIGVEPIIIDSDKKTLYHASAVTAANLLVALMDAALAMAEEAGMSRQEARKMLLPLARSCVDNLEKQSTSDALSGPAARGDRETIERHLDALGGLDDEGLKEIYEVLIARAEDI